MRLFASSAALAATCLLAPGVASAQMSQAIDPQIFVMPAAGGTTFTIDRPSVPRHLSFVFGLGLQWAGSPLVRSNPDGTQTPIVRNLAQADLMGAIGLFEVIELGIGVPLVLGEVADDPLGAPPMYGLRGGPGDLRFSAKVPLVRGDFSLAVRGVLTMPTGDNGHFLAERSWSGLPEAVAAWKIGSLTLAANLGYLLRRRAALYDLEQDDEIHAGAGGVYTIVPALAIVAEAQLRIGLGGRALRSNENPGEVDLGVRIMPSHAISIELGAGTGFLAGYGAPLPRVFAALRYVTEQEPCAAGPEDFDGYQDGDFCADPDNDGDGIPDGSDECPNDAEDRDGFADDDGCPDPDNDADGVPDHTDRCPLQSEDRDGYQDQDGCPEPDNDQDGIPDGLDQCPNDPEDHDNFEDTDGCPEPGPNAATVTVTDTRILISERIYFDFDQDTIRSVSLPLLDQVADVVLHLPGQRRIRVEGYTDNAGVERYNVDLSYRRARAVVTYLASKGVPQNRLTYEGYGSQHPVGPNDTPEGQALNRRVEFTILDDTRGGGGGGGTTQTPAPPTTDDTGGHHHHHHHHGDTAPAPQ